MARVPGYMAMRPPDTMGQRVSTAEERGRALSLPDTIMSEGIGGGGQPLDEQRYGLYRSPGVFAVRTGLDGKSVIIGESWIGPSGTAAEGGLEGCSENCPGIVFTTGGSGFITGGETTKTGAAMHSEAGDYGRTILVALIPPSGLGETGMKFTAVHVADNISDQIGTWDDLSDYTPAQYAEWHHIPIAMLFLVQSGSDVWVTDVFWTNEQPVVPLGGAGSTSIPASQLARITGVYGAAGPYRVAYYAYGLTEPSTGGGLIEIPFLTYGYTLAVGDVILVYCVPVPYTGGTP